MAIALTLRGMATSPIPPLFEELTGSATTFSLVTPIFTNANSDADHAPRGHRTDVSENGFASDDAALAERTWRQAMTYTPRTTLGRRLWVLRASIIASGERQLDWNALDAEARQRNGEGVEDGT